MLKPAVTLESDLTAGEVVRRLVSQGFWLDIDHEAVKQRLASVAERTGIPARKTATRLARKPAGYGVAIRRQRGFRILWYACELTDVLQACWHAPANERLSDVLNLRESQASPPIRVSDSAAAILPTGVLLEGDTPVFVSFSYGTHPVAENQTKLVEEVIFRGINDLLGTAQIAKPLWPSVNSPNTAPAGKAFPVKVGFAKTEQPGVTGGPVLLHIPSGVTAIDLTVQLSIGPGVRIVGAAQQTRRVDVGAIADAEFGFDLVGDEPSDPSKPTLTMIEVTYLQGCVVCGTAARSLAIVHSSTPAIDDNDNRGESWLERTANSSPLSLVDDDQPPDLTIEITKPDHNSGSGHYACQLYSPHPITANPGPHPIDLGTETQAFAQSIVDEIDRLPDSPLLDLALEGNGKKIAGKLPRAVFRALAEVAAKTAPQPPTVLLVSVELSIPWELAWLDAPIDSTRPSYLSAQVLLGRWYRDPVGPSDDDIMASPMRPPMHPVREIKVRTMVAMAAWYQDDSGMRRLQQAEKEVQTIAQDYRAISLHATGEALRQVLKARVKSGRTLIGGIDAMHFAGHGQFSTSSTQASKLFLEDGTPVSSTLFAAAKYGGNQQPLIFFNGCTLGIGKLSLADISGFPGDSLRGGFGGVIGALWSIDDDVARDVALAFWEAALPKTPSRGRRIGEILRDLRANYDPDADSPEPTWLAYSYYGHPGLTLERVD